EQQPRQGFPRYDQPVGGMMERRRGYRSIHNAIVEKGRVHAHDMLDVGEVRTVVGDIAEGDEQGINSKPDHHHDLRISHRIHRLPIWDLRPHPPAFAEAMPPRLRAGRTTGSRLRPISTRPGFRPLWAGASI